MRKIEVAHEILSESRRSTQIYLESGRDYDKVKAHMYSMFECYAHGLINWNQVRTRWHSSILEYLNLYASKPELYLSESNRMLGEYENTLKTYKPALDEYKRVNEQKMTSNIVVKGKLNESQAKEQSNVYFNRRALKESELKDTATMKTWKRVQESYPNLTSKDELRIRMLTIFEGSTVDTTKLVTTYMSEEPTAISGPMQTSMRPKPRPTNLGNVDSASIDAAVKQALGQTSPRPMPRPANLGNDPQSIGAGSQVTRMPNGSVDSSTRGVDPSEIYSPEQIAILRGEAPPSLAPTTSPRPMPRPTTLKQSANNNIRKEAAAIFNRIKVAANEGYKVLPPMDKERYGEIPGLEGPFTTLSGKVVYYDPKEGAYYDRDTDMYLSNDEYTALNSDYSGMQDERDIKVREADTWSKPMSHPNYMDTKNNPEIASAFEKQRQNYLNTIPSNRRNGAIRQLNDIVDTGNVFAAAKTGLPDDYLPHAKVRQVITKASMDYFKNNLGRGLGEADVPLARPNYMDTKNNPEIASAFEKQRQNWLKTNPWGGDVDDLNDLVNFGNKARGHSRVAAGLTKQSMDYFKNNPGRGLGEADINRVKSNAFNTLNKEETELDETYDAAYVKRAIPVLKNAVEFHKDTMEIHDKKSTKGSPKYVRAHSVAAAAHKEAAERHKIAHAQLSHGTKDIAYYINPARELGAYAKKLSDKANALKEETEVDEAKAKPGHNARVMANNLNKVFKAKPDFLDMDKDGDKEEPMKKAAADSKKKVSEAPLLGPQGKIHRAASADQSDREYASQKSFKDAWTAKNVGKKWPGYSEAGYKRPTYKKEESALDEAGAFSYGKKPRKGTVAYNAAEQRKKQEKNEKPTEPKDQKVGNAKVTKESVAESYTGRETKDGTWRVFKTGNAVAVAGPFKSKEEASAWIKKQSSVNEAVTVDYSRYMRAHGKKPRDAGMGSSTWMFTTADFGDPSEDEIFQFQGSFADAKKAAAKWAKSQGEYRFYVMESPNGSVKEAGGIYTSRTPAQIDAEKKAWEPFDAGVRGAVDNITLGTGKYARAAADYGIKNLGSIAGMSDPTTWDTEINQEREKDIAAQRDYPVAWDIGDKAATAAQVASGIGAAKALGTAAIKQGVRMVDRAAIRAAEKTALKAAEEKAARKAASELRYTAMGMSNAELANAAKFSKSPALTRELERRSRIEKLPDLPVVNDFRLGAQNALKLTPKMQVPPKPLKLTPDQMIPGSRKIVPFPKKP